jgi:hypothetical protein
VAYLSQTQVHHSSSPMHILILTTCREHLYRRHALPLRCARCRSEFPTEAELTAHARSQDVCLVQNAEPQEGFDKDQEKILKSRKKSVLTEKQKWKDMFRVLFPDVPEGGIPSPCK